jgi:hypothetical protein
MLVLLPIAESAGASAEGSALWLALLLPPSSLLLMLERPDSAPAAGVCAAAAAAGGVTVRFGVLTARGRVPRGTEMLLGGLNL